MKTTVTVFRSLPLAMLLAFAVTFGACSQSAGGDGDGDGGDGDAAPGFTYCSPANTCPPSLEGVNLEAPAISFRDDLYEDYFVPSCSRGAGCHGNPSGSAANLYFGDEDDLFNQPGDTRISMLIAQLIGADSEIAPGQRNVIPFDWQGSWLMAKLDGCQSDYGIACDADSQFLQLSVCQDPCGDGMPATEGTSTTPIPFPTTEEDRGFVHMVRAWIQQGALDN